MIKFGLVIGQVERIGGMEKQAALLAHELQKRYIPVTLFISGPRRGIKGSRALYIDPIPWKYLYYSSHFKPLSSWLLHYYCNRDGISHLIAFNVENAEIAVKAKIKAKIAMNVRGMRFVTNPLLAEKCKKVASRCDRVITNSENTSELLQRYGIAHKDSIRVIHNGIELPAVKPAPNNKVVLYVGSIKEVKDPMTFIRACHKVIDTDKDVRIVMAGDGNMRPLVESYIADNGLLPYFTLLGEVPYENIPYGEASVYVNSSLSESSSNSLLEALSFGIPSVATANSGNSGVLSGLRHHRLVPVSNGDDMAEAIHSLLDTGPDTRKTIFEESRKIISDHYSVPKMIDDYIETFPSK
jgi:glycosyltransferase involved in cell wall biosynthesis